MPLFKQNVHYAATPGLSTMAGQFVVPANATTVNQQVAANNLSIGSPAVSQLTATQTISPLGTVVPVFCTPNGAAAPAPGNSNNLPRGLATGAQTAGSEYVLDFSGLNADIVSAQAAWAAVARGANNLDCTVSCIDNVNKLIYLQVQSWTAVTAVAPPAGSIISFQVELKDTFSV